MTCIPAVLCDTVQSVAVHNGIARITFVRLDAKNESHVVLELFMPVGQISCLAKAAQSAGR